MKKAINTQNAPAAIGAYSQAIIHNNIMYISGQLPINPQNGEMPQDVASQTHQVLKNIMAILKEHNCTSDNVLKCTIFIKDMNSFATINEIYSQYFKAPYPARATVEIARLPKDSLVEIEVIAFIS